MIDDKKEIDHTKAIEECLSNFDFSKVHDYMTYTKWTWATSRFGVPSTYELIECARRLLKDCARIMDISSGDPEAWISTGGFHASIEKVDTENDYSYSLKFVIEESNYESYCEE